PASEGPPPSGRRHSRYAGPDSGASAGQQSTRGGQRAPRHTPPTPAPTGTPAPPSGSRENVWHRPAGRLEHEIQGGVGQRSGDRPRTGGSLWGVGAFRTAGPAGRGPLRGFPPAPGAPDPGYPPGQASWPNVASERGYSLLAVSDPSADMTATQTWAVLDAGQLGDGWTAPPADPPAAAGTGAALAPGGGAAAPWPPISADAPGHGPAAWANGPADGAGEP